MKKMFMALLGLMFLTGGEVSAETVTRLYNPADGNHWFTTQADKVTSLKSQGWQVEGVAFEANGQEFATHVVTSPNGYYHFTANKDEISGLVAKGWKLGEVVFYASSVGKPIYRVYNPNAGTHHFTASFEEVVSLTNLGWRDEGVAYHVADTAAAVPVLSNNYFIDISSHNGVVTVEDFEALKAQHITGVSIKLTEGTSYINPYAQGQINNARAAGMKISAYHYSHYTNAKEAEDEAAFFVKVAQDFGLTADTLMVGDIEEEAMIPNINANMEAWTAAMHKLGFTNTIYYTGARWLDFKNGPIEVARFGAHNFWLAHYPMGYMYMTQAEAADYAYYNQFAAWQYTSSSPKLARPLDENIDYSGRFTW